MFFGPDQVAQKGKGVKSAADGIPRGNILLELRTQPHLNHPKNRSGTNCPETTDKLQMD